MLCSWLYCWLGMTKYTLSTSLLPLWCRCYLDNPFLLWVFFAINMDTPNFICTKEEQRAVIHFCGLKVYQVSKCIEWCQWSMETVSCHNGLSVNGARGLKMVAQPLSMGKEPDASPHPLLMQTLPALLKTLRNWTLRYWSIPCIVLTLHLQTHLFGSLKPSLTRNSGRVTQIRVFNTVKLGTSASSP